jgi:hypothetical protein
MTPEQNALIKSLKTCEEIFDYVESHLKKQGYRSMLDTDTGRCGYRGEDGAMCAVGCLIADDEYDPCMENHAAMELAGVGGWLDDNLLLPARLIPHARMLEVLQDFHDRSANWSSAKGLSSRGIGQLRILRRMWLEGGLDLE